MNNNKYDIFIECEMKMLTQNPASYSNIPERNAAAYINIPGFFYEYV